MAITRNAIFTRDPLYQQVILVTGWTPAVEPRAVVHPLIGAATPDVSLRAGLLPSGTMTALVESLDRANELLTMHDGAGVVRLLISAPNGSTFLEMYYVPTGTVTAAPATDESALWLVTIPFQQVTS